MDIFLQNARKTQNNNLIIPISLKNITLEN